MANIEKQVLKKECSIVLNSIAHNFSSTFRVMSVLIAVVMSLSRSEIISVFVLVSLIRVCASPNN